VGRGRWEERVGVVRWVCGVGLCGVELREGLELVDIVLVLQVVVLVWACTARGRLVG